MAIEWEIAPLRPRDPDTIPALQRPPVIELSMVGHVMCWTRNGRCSRGSGFVVYPQALVSAAHVVVPWALDGACVPVSACVDLVAARFTPSRVAVPRAWLDRGAPASDVAVLWFDEPLCGSEQPLMLARLDGRRQANVWGSPLGCPRQIAIDAVGSGGEVHGDPRSEIPRGFSGGPWIAAMTQAQDDQTVIGIERDSAEVERALAPPIDDLNAALGHLAAAA